MLVIGLIILLKYALPVVIVVNPFWGAWVNFVLDTIDGDLLLPLGLADPTYQLIDKSADWLTYVGMLAAAYRFKWPIKKWILGLFVLRTIGQVAFFLSGNERVFFLFPNFLEPFFLVYATIGLIKKAKAEIFYKKHRWLIWILVIIYKLQDEWITHIANIDRSELISRFFHF